jgi:hypothetical protein
MLQTELCGVCCRPTLKPFSNFLHPQHLLLYHFILLSRHYTKRFQSPKKTSIIAIHAGIYLKKLPYVTILSSQRIFLLDTTDDHLTT